MSELVQGVRPPAGCALANSWRRCQGQAWHWPWHGKPELRHLSQLNIRLHSQKGHPKVPVVPLPRC